MKLFFLITTQSLFRCSRKKMSSCIMKNQDSDDEVDLEALRLAALKSRKPKYPRVNHSNLISIVPNTPETPDFANTKIKVEKVSPTPEDNVPGDNKDEKGSNFSENLLENTQDILSMDDKEEEDSLERIMDQLEAEISGKTPISSNKNSNEKKRSKKNKKDADDEIELVQIKTGREPGAIIEIRESASPETVPRNVDTRKSISPLHSKSPKRRSRSPFRSKSRSPLLRSRSYRRSRSPYGSKSPRRSRSPFRRSISPFWASRRSRSTSRKRSPFRRYKSPGRNRSPFSCFSRSRSRSFDRRRSSWSPSPRRRSKSPLYWDGYPPARRRNVYSPSERSRRSLTPRDGSKSPRRRSRSPRHYFRNSPYRRSRSPFKRLRSPVRRVKSPIRRSQSPLLRRSKSPNSKLNSPAKRSPHARSPMRSKSPDRRSFSPSKRPKPPERAPSKPRSKSPTKRHEASRRYQGRSGSKNERNFSFSTSPTARRNRSPLRAVEKNKLDANDKSEKPKDRRNEKRHRSLSRENNKRYDRRTHRQKYLRWFSPSRTRRSADRQRKKSKSPVKAKETDDKSKEEAAKQSLTDKGTSPVSAVPLDPILEARKKKFENQNEVDPTVDKKISLKSIKESTELAEDDDDALTINIESNLWDESEESEDEFESRFKSGDSKKKNNRTIFSFRNLREGDGSSAKMILNKPLTEENRRDRFGRTDRHDRWQNSRKNDRSSRRNRTYSDGNKKNDENDKNKSKNNDKNNFQTSNSRTEKRSDRKPIVWSSKDEKKPGKDLKDNEVTTTQSESKEEKSRNSEKTLNEKVGKDEADDFDKFISDFEKELESDNCISTNKVNSEGVKKPKISVKKNLFEPKANVESTVKKPTGGRTLKINESSHKVEKNNEVVDSRKDTEETNKVEVNESQPMNDGPEDYIEDDDFVLEESARRNSKNRVEEEDSSSDLRAVLSRRRNARLTKVVSLQENMPTRLVQSAFQGLGNKKSRKQVREVQDSLQFSSFEKNIKNTGEGRRVLLLQREKNPSLPYIKCAVPDSNPDTTVYQRLTRSSERKRKHKLKMQLEPVDDMDQEEYEEDVFEVEEEKQSRRFRLKRNVTLSSQGDSEHPFPSYLYIR